jgi:hypothetical protein
VQLRPILAEKVLDDCLCLLVLLFRLHRRQEVSTARNNTSHSGGASKAGSTDLQSFESSQVALHRVFERRDGQLWELVLVRQSLARNVDRSIDGGAIDDSLRRCWGHLGRLWRLESRGVGGRCARTEGEQDVGQNGEREESQPRWVWWRCSPADPGCGTARNAPQAGSYLFPCSPVYRPARLLVITTQWKVMRLYCCRTSKDRWESSRQLFSQDGTLQFGSQISQPLLILDRRRLSSRFYLCPFRWRPRAGRQLAPRCCVQPLPLVLDVLNILPQLVTRWLSLRRREQERVCRGDEWCFLSD